MQEEDGEGAGDGVGNGVAFVAALAGIRQRGGGLAQGGQQAAEKILLVSCLARPGVLSQLRAN